MALIQLIGQKVDGLRTSHDSSRREIMSQFSVMDGKLTKPPNPPKTHGFAITRKQLDDDLQELRFIAGQSKYVARRARSVQGEVIVPFTENGNPIDLRNNFQKKANERARDHFGGARSNKRAHVELSSDAVNPTAPTTSCTKRSKKSCRSALPRRTLSGTSTTHSSSIMIK
ncbi:hypothetical protein GN958_ATG06285 [Phytophthora infestans]|uniref:Uncharacterized protein n=1 Tax=Phytophthora infestans TaxID=4787 RepID=A0A8S9UV69_PHYIN|nr:hypothetical protein GN958_ATG06285 [Phytophthora infestans]